MTGTESKGSGEALVRQAAVGAVVGWTIGAAQVGRGLSSPLRFYDPVPVRMAVSPALDAWVVLARMVRLGAPRHLVASHYLDSWRYPAGAAGFGLANLDRGVPPPLSGFLGNPLAEGAGALGRAVFWGLAFHGDPESAADAAVYDASFDHSGEGVWCSAAVAWVTALAGPETEYRSLVSGLSSLLPPASSLGALLPVLMGWMGKPDGFVHGSNAFGGGPESVRTAAAALLAAGEGSFASAVGSAAVCEGDRPTAALVAGTIAALRWGVLADWVAPLGAEYVAGHGLRGVDPPRALDDFAEMVVGAFLHRAPDLAVNRDETEAETPLLPLEAEAAIVAAEVATEATVPNEPVAVEAKTTEAEPEATAAQPLVVPASPSRGLVERLAREGHACLARLDGLDLEAVYVEGVASVPGQAVRFDLRLSASTSEETVVSVKVRAPDGWELATRATEFRAQPGRVTSFPTVVKSPATWDRTTQHLVVDLNHTEVALPLIAMDGWAWAGPMLNADGSGFDQVFLPEKGQEKGQAFATRSGLSSSWRPFDGDLDAACGSAPGVLYLAADVDFGAPGRYDLVCGAKGGVRVWVDGKQVVQANDSRGVDLGSPGPFQAEVATAGTSRVLVKLVRGKTPLGGLVFVVYREDGSVVFPVVRDVLSR